MIPLRINANAQPARADNKAVAVDYKVLASQLIYANAQPCYELATQECKDQINSLLTKLKDWGREQQIFDFPDDTFTAFAEKFNAKNFADWNDNDYQNIKQMLEKIYIHLKQNQHLPLPYRITQYKNLIPQLGVCAGGTYISINSIQNKLNVQMGVAGWLESMRATIVTEQIANTLHQHAYRGWAQGMHSHYVNACSGYAVQRNLLPQKYLADIKDAHAVNLSEDEQAEFDHLYAEQCTVGTQVTNLVMELSNYVYDQVEAFVKDPQTTKTTKNLDTIFEQAFAMVGAMAPPLQQCRELVEQPDVDDKKDAKDAKDIVKDAKVEIFSRDSTKPQILRLPVYTEVTRGDYQELISYVKLKSKNEFQELLRPYITGFLILNDHIVIASKVEHRLPNGDKLVACDESAEHSLVKTEAGEIFFYKDYLQQNPANVPVELQNIFRFAHLRKLVDASKNSLQQSLRKYKNRWLNYLLFNLLFYSSKVIYGFSNWCDDFCDIFGINKFSLTTKIILAIFPALFIPIILFIGSMIIDLAMDIVMWVFRCGRKGADYLLQKFESEYVLNSFIIGGVGLIIGMIASPFLAIWEAILFCRACEKIAANRIAPLEDIISILSHEKDPDSLKRQLTAPLQVFNDCPDEALYQLNLNNFFFENDTRNLLNGNENGIINKINALPPLAPLVLPPPPIAQANAVVAGTPAQLLADGFGALSGSKQVPSSSDDAATPLLGLNEGASKVAAATATP